MEGDKGQRSFEVFFTSPLCWKSLKICQFLINVSEYLKEDAGKPLRNKLKTEALRAKLWHPHSNWKVILGEKHFSILATFKQNVSYNVNVTSLLDLLQIIRNKYVHTKEFSDVEKKELGWYTKVYDNWTFSLDHWTEYWVSRFPRVLPFLWNNLKHVCQSGKLSKFYPNWRELEYNNLDISTDNLLEHVEEILKQQVNSGLVDERYTLETKSTKSTIEFKSLSGEIIAEILDRSTSLILIVSNKIINVMWCGTSAELKFYSTTNKCQGVSKFDKLGIVIANSICDIDSNYVSSQIGELGKIRKFIVFTKQREYDSINYLKSVSTFLEALNESGDLLISKYPVNWLELNESTRNRIIENGGFTYQFEDTQADRILVLKHALPYECASKNKIMSSVHGDMLNKLIRNQKPVIFGKQKVSAIPQYYVARPLQKEAGKQLNCKESVDSDILVFLKFTDQVVSELIRKDVEGVGFASVLNLKANLVERCKDAKMIMFREDIPSGLTRFVLSAIKVQTGKQGEEEKRFVKNIHCFRSTENLEFFMETKPPFRLKLDLHKILTEKSTLFAELPHEFTNKDRIIFIADKPGMGKSMVLTNISVQSAMNFRTWNHLNVVASANEFVEQIGLINLSKTKICTAISEFVCDSEFEKRLLKKLLVSNLQVELFLDGLDEVNVELKDLAIDVLEFIKIQMPNIRVWITSRDHMLTESLKQLACSVYKIKPFTKADHINLIVSYLQYEAKFSVGSELKSRKELQNFARKCLETPEARFKTFMSDSPLISRMLVDVYVHRNEENVLVFNLSKPVSIMEIFEKAIDHKLAAYIENCKECPNYESIFYALREQLEHSHMYFALALILGANVAEKFKRQLLTTTECIERLNSCVLKQGIIVSLNPSIAFIHRTFAEYFVAKFVWKVLNQEFLMIHETDTAFQDLLNNNVFQSYPTKKNKISCKYYLLDFKLYDFWLFLDYFCQDKRAKQTVQNRVLLDRTRSCLERASNIFVLNSLHNWAPALYAINVENCFHLLEIFLMSEKHLTDLFTVCLASGLLGFSKYFIECVPGFGPEYWQEFRSKNANMYGLLHWVAKGICLCERDSKIPFYEKLSDFILKKDKTQLELKDCNGSTPLLLLLKDTLTYGPDVGNIQMLHWFVSNGANVNATDNNNNTILHVAYDKIEEDYISVKSDFEYLSERYLSIWSCLETFGVKLRKFINKPNDRGYTPLLSAVDFFGDNMTNQLLQFDYYEANFNAKDNDGNTVLHIAVSKNCNFKFVSKLVELGSNVNAQNAKGNTALQLAVEKENILLAELLIRGLNADTKTKDSSGKSVHDYETSEKMRRVLEQTKPKRKKPTSNRKGFRIVDPF